MKLNHLLERLLIKQIEGNDTIEITNIEIDSRKVSEGNLFICLSGTSNDGHWFIKEAIHNGAAAILVEKDVEHSAGITIVRVPDTRRAMAVLSDYFYGQPTHQLRLIGVTGTNGKTTTTHLIEKILNDHGNKTGLIGTLYMKIDNHIESTANTTPDAPYLQCNFKKMIEHGAEYAVLEVSSHALDMGRVRGCRFKTAVFTNLTHDHLDYHQTMEHYGDVKSLLFSQMGNIYQGSSPQFVVLNADDPAAKHFAKKTAAQIVTYGIDNRADVHVAYMQMNPDGTDLIVDTFRGSVALHLKCIGKCNVYNALAALSVGLVEDVPLDQIKRSLETFSGVSGRFEAVTVGQNFTVIVDYAHNPNGLKNVLDTVKALTKGKLICVCGCEGDRDRKKRPEMARIAVTYSDIAIFTSDNCRSEEPEDIISEMIDGIRFEPMFTERYVPIVSRNEAIHYAIEKACPGDCIVIAGRGHETHMIVKEQRIPFNDKEVIIETLAQFVTI